MSLWPKQSLCLTFSDGFGGLAGVFDIKLDDALLFNDIYLLQGRDPAAIKAFFTPERVRFLEKIRLISMECAQGGALIFRLDEQIDPDGLEYFMEEVVRIKQHLVVE